ncbi:MAG: restriction endonuclease subunit S [Prevotella sp.]|nr:restriction endonuclease subunit S [Prevotella sp.]
MKEGWTYKKLGEVGSTQTGTTPSKSNPDNYGSHIPFIRPAEISADGSGHINYDSEIKLSKKGLNNGRLFKKGSILMVCIGTIGKLGFADEDISCNQQINVLKPNEQYVPKYLFYAMSSPSFQRESIKIAQGAQATIPIINKGKWSNLLIPIPPTKDEQKWIVSRLDAAFSHIDELKANAEKQLSEARTLFQKSLVKAMEPKEGWEEKKLIEITHDNCPISYGIVQQGDHIDGGIPVVRPVDMREKYITRENLKCTTQTISDSYKRTILRGDELLLSVRGTTGIISLATPELKGCNVNRGIVPLYFKDQINKDFLYYEMVSPLLQSVFAEKTTGSTLKQINIKDLRLIKLSLPPLSEQQRIVERLDALSVHVRELEENQKKIISECDALKQALLRKVFE